MSPAVPTPVEPLISMAEVAARLGVPLKTFRRWREHHAAPVGYRLGGRVQFRWSEVEAWLQTQREADTRRPTVIARGGRRSHLSP